MKQEQVYKDNGFKVVRAWGCMWKEHRKEIQVPDNAGKNITVGKYVNRISHDTVNNRLLIDKSLVGGRTDPFAYYYPQHPVKRLCTCTTVHSIPVYKKV